MEQVHCRFSKVKNNRLLNRVQMVVDVIHPREKNLTKDEIKEFIKTKFKKSHISLIQVKKSFGGGRTRGIALVYDNEESLKRFELERRLERDAREHKPKKDRKSKEKKDTRKKKKIRKHQDLKKRGTKRRQDKVLERKQKKKTKK